MLCQCPLPVELADIPAASCPVKLDQIVKIFFQRKQASEPFFVTALNAITSVASWTTALAASDSTKVTVSPFFSGLVIPMSESITTGGNDNSTAFGLPEYQGEGNITVEAMFKNVEPARIRALKDYSCESFAQAGLAGLTAYFVTRDGRIAAKGDLATPTGYSGIDIFNFRVSSRGSEGYNANDTVALRFDMKPDWADFLEITTPADFNALSLAPA